jgi:hypothetical protein
MPPGFDVEARMKFIADTKEAEDQYKEMIRNLHAELTKLGVIISSDDVERMSKSFDKQGDKKKDEGYLGEAAKAGGVAGAVAGGVLALIGALQDMAKQSAILSTIQETLGKAVGLLIDVILIPFLPIIMWALINVFMAIMEFKKWWDDTIESIKKEGVLGLLKVGISLVGDIIDSALKWAWNMIDKIFFGGELSKSANYKIGVNTETSGDDSVWKKISDWLDGSDAGKFIKFNLEVYAKSASDLLDWLFSMLGLGGEGADERAKKNFVSVSINASLGFLGEMLQFLYAWITGDETKKLKIQIDMANTVGNWIKDIQNTDIMKKVLGTETPVPSQATQTGSKSPTASGGNTTQNVTVNVQGTVISKDQWESMMSESARKAFDVFMDLMRMQNRANGSV